jgi:DNA-binding NarL/FixJ family response regulator
MPESNKEPQASDPPIRVMVVDDHFMARIGLSMPINSEPDMEVVAEARTGHEAVDLYERLQPDVVTLDYRLPDKDGPEVAADILKASPQARMLMLSAFGGEETVHRALRAGVRGYLLKSAACSEELKAIRLLHAGGTALPNDLAEKVRNRGDLPDFSDRDVHILKKLAQGTTNKEIAAQLGFSESLIKQELVRIFQQLGAHDRAHAATLAIQRGILDLEAE